MSDLPIEAPAPYVPISALAYGGLHNDATAVDAQNPLPVTFRPVAGGSAVLAGTASAQQLAGPFHARAGAPIRVVLSGTWTGSARLERSVDGGATLSPLTVAGAPWARFTGNCDEAVTEEFEDGASYYLRLAPAAGTISYRVSQ